MPKITVNQELVGDLLKLALQAGVSISQAVAVMRQHGVDPAVYQSVIDDRRTFEDFHGKNPREQPPEVPPEPTVPPSDDPTVRRYADVNEAIQAMKDRGYTYVLSYNDGSGYGIWPNIMLPAAKVVYPA
jgi:hypothetical protein